MAYGDSCLVFFRAPIFKGFLNTRNMGSQQSVFLSLLPPGFTETSMDDCKHVRIQPKCFFGAAHQCKICVASSVGAVGQL